jgi:hypothetical protein
MRKIGTPITIRIDDDVLALVRREAACLKKPLRSFLRELIESNYRQTFTKPLSSVKFPKNGANMR